MVSGLHHDRRHKAIPSVRRTYLIWIDDWLLEQLQIFKVLKPVLVQFVEFLLVIDVLVFADVVAADVSDVLARVSQSSLLRVDGVTLAVAVAELVGRLSDVGVLGQRSQFLKG